MKVASPAHRRRSWLMGPLIWLSAFVRSVTGPLITGRTLPLGKRSRVLKMQQLHIFLDCDLAADAQRLQFAVQGRALHADEFRRARDVSAEARNLRQEIFPLEDLASIPE